MDLVALDLVILEVAAVFGRFVKYACTVDQSREDRLRDDNVCMRSIHCYEPLEQLYLSVGQYKLLCIFCCSNEDLVTKEGCYLPMFRLRKQRTHQKEDVVFIVIEGQPHSW